MYVKGVFGSRDLDAGLQCRGFWEDRVQGSLQLELQARLINANHEHYGFEEMNFLVPPFRDECRIDTLTAYPLRYHADPEGTRSRLLSLGRKFVSLTSGAGAHHRQYKGDSVFRVGSKQEAYKWDARIMVDPAGLARIESNRVQRQFPLIAPGPTGWLDPTAFGEEELLCCSPIVLAFNLVSCEWGTWKTFPTSGMALLTARNIQPRP